MLTIEDNIREQSRINPYKTALIDGASGKSVSYGKLWEEILRAAYAFRSNGLKRGDRIVVAATKSLEFVYRYFGAHEAGLIVAPVDSEINNTRLARIVDAVRPKIVIGLEWEGKLPDPTDIKPDRQDIADILFTTGTTGAPKGVALSFANEAAAARNINQFIENTDKDVELLALPISHSFGLGRLRCMLSIGATTVMLPSGFASMKKFFGTMEKYKVTGFGMVPASWAYISKMSGDRITEFADQLRYIEMGSAPLPASEKQRIMDLLPHTKICMHYGLTEASRSTFLNFSAEKDMFDTAGKASPNCKIAIFSDSGEELPANHDGEVCVKGDHVCSGYWNVPTDQYEKDFFEGYFRTGDWGSIDKKGYLRLKSRTKEMINVGGKKVSPMEVEETLLTIDGITEAACVAKPDPLMGEVVKAFVVGTLTTADNDNIIANISRKLENYKIPAEIVHVDSLPRTESGKLQRLKLKDI